MKCWDRRFTQSYQFRLLPIYAGPRGVFQRADPTQSMLYFCRPRTPLGLNRKAVTTPSAVAAGTTQEWAGDGYGSDRLPETNFAFKERPVVPRGGCVARLARATRGYQSVECEIRQPTATACVSSSTMNRALLLTLWAFNVPVGRPRPRRRYQILATREPDQAARKSARIAGRSVAGGNTHHEPSSCRKKKIASDPADREASTQTYRR
jgi:hypothetical protein